MGFARHVIPPLGGPCQMSSGSKPAFATNFAREKSATGAFSFGLLGSGRVGLLASGLNGGCFSEAFALKGGIDFFLGHLAEFSGEPEFVKGPNGPFGGVEMPRFHPVTIVVLKFVMIIVVAFTEGYEGHHPAVASSAAGGIRLGAEGVTEGVDAEGAMLDSNEAGDPGKEEPPQGSGPAVPKKTEGGREDKADDRPEPFDVAMLPHGQFIFLNVRDVIKGRFGI